MNQESLTTFAVPPCRRPTDRASLEGLSKDEVRAWALRKSEECRLLSYAMLSLHNDAAPIHSLPVELLMKIFGMTWSLKGRLSPTSVCRRWHTVYQSTRAFWAEILAELLFVQGNDEWFWTWRLLRQPSLELVTALLEKSAPHPIPLEIVQTLEELEVPPLPPCVFPSTAYPHLRHVVNINIDTTLLHLHDLYRVLNAGMPTLEILDIRASEAEPPNLARTLASLCPVADESLPRLYCLRLDPAIFFPLIAVRSLEDIYLDSFKAVDGTVPWPHPASSNSRSLLRALSRCHNLECLRLEDFNYSRWWPPLACLGRTHERSGTVQLPSLKKLSLGCELWLPCAKAVLAALDPCIPSAASVQLGYDDPESLSILIPSHLAQHHPFDTVLISRSCVRASVIRTRCFAAQSLRMDIQFGSPRNLADLGIDNVFRTAHVTRLEIIHHLDIYGDQYAMATGMPVEDWAAVLRTFSHLTHLTVSGANAPSDVVDALVIRKNLQR